MRFLISLALFLLSQQNPATSLRPAMVQGRVTDSVTAQPLVRATVQLRGVRNNNAVIARDTGADGTFLFPNVPPGEYTIEASATSYIPDMYGDGRDEFTPAIHTLTSGQTRSGVEIALKPAAAIYGRIIDDRGELVVGATVQARRTRYRQGLREYVVVQSVTSNDLGEYRLYKLPPGDYRVSVTARSFTRASIPWYVPGNVASKDRPIDLRVGQTMGGLDISSFPTRGYIVSGTVSGLSGSGATVILGSKSGDVQMSKTVAVDTNAFEFKGIPPGAYTLVAKVNDLDAALPVDVRSADILNARLTLAQGIRIPVRVRIEGHGDGDDPALEKLYFAIRQDPPIPGLNTDMYSPFANGRFNPALLPGDYRVELTQTDDMYLKSIRLGDVDVLARGLQVPPASDAQLEIIVGSHPGSVQGRTAGKGVTVVLVPDPDRRNQRTLFKAMPPGASGEFTFAKVPPGDYKLFAWREENGGPWLDPEYLRRYEDRGTPVRVDEGQVEIVPGMIPLL